MMLQTYYSEFPQTQTNTFNKTVYVYQALNRIVEIAAQNDYHLPGEPMPKRCRFSRNKELLTYPFS